MTQSTLSIIPYKGLIPYAEEDAPFFFGRDADREIIVANLMSRRLTLLYGPSGVGKSSVLRAGVAHDLSQQAQQHLAKHGAPEFTVVVFNEWRDDPMPALKKQIEQAVAQSVLRNTAQPAAPEDFVEFLKACANQLGHQDDVGSGVRVGGRLFIIFDQFEEYFLYHSQEDGPSTFAAEFPRAVNDPDLPVNFIISIREDVYAKLDRFEGRVPRLFDSFLRIEHLDRENARKAIENPIARYNQLLAGKDQAIEIEPALVDAVLDQVKTGEVVIGEAGRGVIGGEESEEQIETPFLQLVMTRLWQEEMRAGSRTLRLETLNRLGGAKHIVESHLDAAMHTLTPDQQHVASLIFQHLVTHSGAKIAYPVLDLAEDYHLSPLQIISVVERLSGSEARILRPVAAPLAQPDLIRYEIFHDVLAGAILDWRRQYIETQERAETERQLEIEAQERAKAEQQLAREQKLVRRQRLGLAVMAVMLLGMIALTWWALEQRTFARNAEVREKAQRAEAILQRDRATNALRDAEAARDETKHAFEMEATQRKEADAQRKEAESQRNAAEVAKVEANAQRLTAEESKTEAEKQRDLAQQALGSADTAAREAGRQKLIAEEQTKIAQSRELAAIAISQLQTDPDLGVLLAIEGLKVKSTNQATDALRQSLMSLPVRTVMSGHADSVKWAAFSPDSKLIVTASEDKTARIWDAETKQGLHELLGHTDKVNEGSRYSFTAPDSPEPHEYWFKAPLLAKTRINSMVS